MEVFVYLQCVIVLLASKLCCSDLFPGKRLLIGNVCPNITDWCTLQCQYGYRQNPMGCDMCNCSPARVIVSSSNNKIPTTAAMITSPVPTPSNHMYIRPCLAAQPSCMLNCSHGYLTGSDGCQFCFCASLEGGVVTPVPYTTPTSAPGKFLSNPCIASQTTCSKNCQYGFLKGPGYCDYCVCAPENLMITTTTLPTTTVPAVTLSAPFKIPNPCVAGQTSCNLYCKDGYIKGPDNCNYCLCSPKYTTVGVTSPTTTTPMVTEATDVAKECIIATTICQLKCKGGFMTDPAHCTYCLCKDFIYNQTGVYKIDEPMIQLMNPCVKGVDLCRIFCAEGYLIGPRGCQYCACRH